MDQVERLARVLVQLLLQALFFVAANPGDFDLRDRGWGRMFAGVASVQVLLPLLFRECVRQQIRHAPGRSFVAQMDDLLRAVEIRP